MSETLGMRVFPDEGDQKGVYVPQLLYYLTLSHEI